MRYLLQNLRPVFFLLILVLAIIIIFLNIALVHKKLKNYPTLQAVNVSNIAMLTLFSTKSDLFPTIAICTEK